MYETVFENGKREKSKMRESKSKQNQNIAGTDMVASTHQAVARDQAGLHSESLSQSTSYTMLKLIHPGSF